MRGRLSKVLALALLAVLLSASAGDATQRPGSGPRGANPVERIRIIDNRFQRGSITVERGTVVKWVNRGANTHTSTSDTGVWDSDNLLPGESFRRRFRRTGTFAYHCNIHSDMTGTITVE